VAGKAAASPQAVRGDWEPCYQGSDSAASRKVLPHGFLTGEDAAWVAQSHIEVHGQAEAGFEAVRHAFADNFVHGGELGAACCVCHHSEKVVDLWAGLGNATSGTRWAEDTMVPVYSATKGSAAMVMALAIRGWLDYEERVSTWPEFAQNGKKRITVRQLLSHQGGSSRLMSRSTAPLSLISIAWQRYLRAKSRPGRPANAKPITP
jgi:CubicO group peptidase (beta-lactamase class C family)